MRRLAAVATLVACAIHVAAATTLAQAKSPPSPAERKKSAEKILAAKTALDETTVPLLKLDGSLESAFASIADVAHVTVKPDWESLESVGLKRRESLVKADLRNVKAAKALAIVLRDAAQSTKGADRKPAALTYYIDDDGNVIPTTRGAYIKANTIEREYDIADLVRAANGGNQPKATDAEKLAAGIIKLIEEAVEPDSWDSAQGTPGKIRFVDGKLKVTQLKENQVTVRQLIKEMRNSYQLPQPPDEDSDGGL